MSKEEFAEKLKEAEVAGHNIGACLRVQYRNRFLLLRRSASDFCAGIYEIPGGSVDTGEILETAAARELFEEAGINVSVDQLEPIGIFEFHNVETGKHKTKFAFAVHLSDEPEIKLSPDHDEYKFLTREEIDALPRQGRDEKYVLWEDHYRVLCL